jgi:hypothetical protein
MDEVPPKYRFKTYLEELVRGKRITQEVFELILTFYEQNVVEAMRQSLNELVHCFHYGLNKEGHHYEWTADEKVQALYDFVAEWIYDG